MNEITDSSHASVPPHAEWVFQVVPDATVRDYLLNYDSSGWPLATPTAIWAVDHRVSHKWLLVNHSAAAQSSCSVPRPTHPEAWSLQEEVAPIDLALHCRYIQRLVSEKASIPDDHHLDLADDEMRFDDLKTSGSCGLSCDRNSAHRLIMFFSSLSFRNEITKHCILISLHEKTPLPKFVK
ncbi:hypothetical protein ASPBRDRAFT_26761 [Aspergillus brasiliensis CBS 101740]|uniref:Uncharacterized protein n=1 Tax=Aspergillus brasiliensis (strain CBS 101740 / IMI 381727 / IBT 21946) TaxID=767769 RepID=A0A1L9UXE4_ASPBC|nr:hypothetical protein ASPBRDRAFT_26761 [Aspergillus brasiliensis CBS 101740]